MAFRTVEELYQAIRNKLAEPGYAEKEDEDANRAGFFLLGDCDREQDSCCPHCVH